MHLGKIVPCLLAFVPVPQNVVSAISLKRLEERAIKQPFPHDNPAGITEEFARDTGGSVIPVTPEEFAEILWRDGINIDGVHIRDDLSLPPQLGTNLEQIQNANYSVNLTDPNDPVWCEEDEDDKYGPDNFSCVVGFICWSPWAPPNRNRAWIWNSTCDLKGETKKWMYSRLSWTYIQDNHLENDAKFRIETSYWPEFMYGKDYYGSWHKGWKMWFPFGRDNYAVWYYRNFFKCEE